MSMSLYPVTSLLIRIRRTNVWLTCAVPAVTLGFFDDIFVPGPVNLFDNSELYVL